LDKYVHGSQVRKWAWLPKYNSFLISERKDNHVALEGQKDVLINTIYSVEMINVNKNINKSRLLVGYRNAMEESERVDQQPKNYPFLKKRGNKYYEIFMSLRICAIDFFHSLFQKEMAGDIIGV
jgi:hypothetical protein